MVIESYYIDDNIKNSVHLWENHLSPSHLRLVHPAPGAAKVRTAAPAPIAALKLAIPTKKTVAFEPSKSE
jgi:hypothetical protein